MKRHIHYNAHPIDPQPFEAFWYGSWQAVERLRISVGTITTHVLVNGEVIEENIPVTNLRMRSRKATLSDCACFLRPGLEVCVLSIPYQGEDSGDEKDVKPVWIDAKIRSIERKPHELTCTCKFYVSVYVTQGPPPILKKTLSKEINLLSIDQIAILQKLEPKPCEDKHYRWSSSEDCNSLQTFKLFIGKFSSDLTWLLTASVLKEAAFDVRSIHNQIVYEIVDDDLVKKESNSDQHSYSVNFTLENGFSTTTVFQFSRDIPDINPTGDLSEAGPLVLYDLMGPRRSKRRFVQPERYYGCDDDLSEFDVEMTRLVGGRRKVEYEELPLALSIQDDHAYRNGEIEEIARSYKRELFGGNIRPHGKKSSESSSGWRNAIKSDENMLAEKKSVTADRQHQLAIVPLHPSSGSDLIVHEQVPLDVDVPEDVSAEISEIVSRYIYFNSSSTHDRKASKMNFTKPEARRWGQVKISKLKFMGLDRRGGTLGSHKKYKRNTSKKDSIYDIRSFKKGSVAANVYKELIRRCMANIDATLNKEQPPIIDQWKEFQSTKSSHRESAENLSINKEEEVSEIDMLWKEMELALASCYLLDDSEDSHVQYASNVRIGAEIRGEVCRHDYRLNEEIGIICRLCGFVSTEIKDVPPPFMPSSNYNSSKEQRTEEVTDHKQDDGLDTLSIPASSSVPSSSGEEEENVWALIPDLGNKLRVHQKRAFEFLWKNIAGSIVPAEMQPESKERGGCVISHTPGAGKTLLIISFLVSYLKLFPGSRPLVLAPKTTLYTWYKEVLKWKIPVPVYQIHGGQTFKGEVLREGNLCGGSSSLKLPRCNFPTSKKGRLSSTLKIIISVASALFGVTLVLMLLILCFLKRKHSPSPDLADDSFLKISYGELLKATNGFSSDNLIGKGGFGSVYKGILGPDEKTVAIKVLDLQHRGALKSFIAECEVLKNLRHRNLVKLVTACSGTDFQGNDFKALIYEFMVNGSLDDWLHSFSYDGSLHVRYLDLYQRVNIATDIAFALDYLHHGSQTPVVHCDLKPSNVLLDKDMTARVGDFGLSRFLQETSQRETSTIGIKGSVGYAAPEYGMVSEVSTYGDIYSYGIIILEMLTGKKPTDDAFSNGMNLHNYTKMAFSTGRVMEIVDQMLCHSLQERKTKDYIKECSISMCKIGIACTMESPKERMGINDVVKELQLVKQTLSKCD